MLAGKYPKIEERRSLTFSGPAGPQVSQDTDGWQMKSDDGSWAVTLDPHFYSLETSAYTSWSDFRTRLLELVAAVGAVHGPKVEERLGLRMVDEINHSDVTSPSDWTGLIRPQLLGPLSDEDFGTSITAIQQIVEMDAGGGYKVLFRHGSAPSPRGDGWLYVLDHDCFRQAGQVLTEDGILSAADDLHRIALQVFEAAITDELYDYLEPEERQ
jgi:uncharacterized protein (TIGR04255 family)